MGVRDPSYLVNRCMKDGHITLLSDPLTFPDSKQFTVNARLQSVRSLIGIQKSYLSLLSRGSLICTNIECLYHSSYVEVGQVVLVLLTIEIRDTNLATFCKLETTDNEDSSMILLNKHLYIQFTLKEINSQTDLYIVSLSSKTYVFEDKLTKY